MAVRTKEEIFEMVHQRIGNDSSDESIKFLEDVTDTMNDLDKKANGGGTDWEKKYHELDESWKAKYKHRFFNGEGGNYDPTISEKKSGDEYDPESITVEQLFK